jgi:TPR repeat protein
MRSNLTEAVEYYEKAADLHHISALKAFGDCLMSGRGVEVNQEFGIEKLQLAQELLKYHGMPECGWLRWLN